MDATTENDLERLLRLAASEPAHRPEFVRALLASDVYVLGSAGADGERVLEEGTNVEIQSWVKSDGSAAIPFFSSLDVLRRSIDAEQSYMRLPARALFEITAGASLVLNPRSDYGKEFLPDEVAQILATGIGREPQRRVVERETQVLLGQPSVYPARMVESVSKLLATHSNVSRAFLALMHDPSVDEKAHLVIGIEADGDVAQVIREVGSVAADTAPDGEAVDLFRVARGDGDLSDYMVSTPPFYERRRVSKLRSLLGW